VVRRYGVIEAVDDARLRIFIVLTLNHTTVRVVLRECCSLGIPAANAQTQNLRVIGAAPRSRIMGAGHVYQTVLQRLQLAR
jgi:hypothetical protein